MDTFYDASNLPANPVDGDTVIIEAGGGDEVKFTYLGSWKITETHMGRHGASAITPPSPAPGFDTWNPADASADWTLSGGDLTATNNNNGVGIVRSVNGISSGKQYWEFTDFVGAQYTMVGICDGAHTLATYQAAKMAAYFSNNGHKAIDAAAYPFAAYGSPWFFLHTISVLEDHDAGTISFWLDGVDQGVLASGLTGTWYAMVSSAGNIGDGGTANFGATAFTYTPPAGYNAGRY